VIRVAALVVAALLVGGCGVHGQDRAVEVEADEVPFGLLDAEAQPAVTLPRRADDLVAACFLRGDLLAEVPVAVADRRAATVLEALASPPVIAGDDLRTAAPATGAAIVGVRVDGGVATVDLTAGIDQLVTGPDLRDFAAQVVCTLTAQRGIGQVAFTIAGEPASVPTGDGTSAAGPVTREDYAALVAGSG
jgi:hypothetical protein